jgi:hypothetical protein
LGPALRAAARPLATFGGKVAVPSLTEALLDVKSDGEAVSQLG